MKTSDLVLVALLLGALVVLVAVTAIPAVGRLAAGSVSRRLGLALPPELMETVRRRVTRRTFAGAAGAFLATVAAVAVLTAGVVTPLRDIGTIWFVLGAYFAGLSVGAALSAVTEQPGGDDTRPRVARAGAVTVADYVAPVDRIGARVVVGLAALALLISAVVAGNGGELPRLTTGVAIVALAVASLVFFEIASRRIIDRGQPVGSTAELAWDDALRASALRDIITAPIVLGFWGLVFNASDHANEGGPAGTVTLIVLAILLASAFGVALFSLTTRPAQHYLRRLWPDVAAAAQVQLSTAQANTPGSSAR